MNEKLPLVSICIPTYNRAKLVQCAIASAQAQSYPNIEIIVTDNFSTDNTEEVVRSIAAKDPRVRYIRNETNIGPTRNWQVAVNAAKGEYCKILYSDDEITNDFIATCVELYQKGNDVGFVLTDSIIGPSFDHGELSQGCNLPEGYSDSKDYILNYLTWEIATVSPSCALFKTSDLISKIVITNPYFEIDKYAQNGAGPDSLIFLNTAQTHSQVAYAKRPLTLFRTGRDSISSIAAKEEETLTRLMNCYAKARYHFLVEHSGTKSNLWYLRFLMALTGAVRKSHVRKMLAADFKLKGHRAFSIIDFAIGCLLRQYKDRLVKARLAKILAID